MRLIPARAWLLVVLSAILQVAIFPIAGPVPVWRTSLAWIALVPLLVALLSHDRDNHALSVKNSACLGYLCGICWYLGNCYWIYRTMNLYGGLPRPVALGILLLFSLYLGLYHALFTVLVAFLRRAWPAICVLFFIPFAWVAVELARARITSFPWDLLGNSLVDNLFVTRLAPVAGVMGISFIVVAINAALALFFLTEARKRLVAPILATLVALALQIFATPGTHGHLPRKITGATPFAVMVQENIEVGAVGREVKPLTRFQELELFTQLSLAPDVSTRGEQLPQLPPSMGAPPTLIIWPEAPSQLQSNDPSFRAAMSNLADRSQAPLIIGSLGVDFDPAAPRGYFLYDSATLFAPSSGYSGRYDKIHLVPWGEYVPFQQFLSFAQKLTEGVGDMDRGKQRKIFLMNGHIYGIFICYESIFGDEVRQFVNNGAEVLVNISDDGWYGDTGAPWQHLNMVRMRAIENHRWILRSTNTGITSAIDPQGRVSSEAPRHIRAAFVMPFGFEQGTTFYTRHGDWFAWLCLLVTLLASASAFTQNRNSHR